MNVIVRRDERLIIGKMSLEKTRVLTSGDYPFLVQRIEDEAPNSIILDPVLQKNIG